MGHFRAALLIRTDGLVVPPREDYVKLLAQLMSSPRVCGALALALDHKEPNPTDGDRVALVFTLTSAIRLHDRVAQLEAQLAEALVHERSERGPVDLGVSRG